MSLFGLALARPRAASCVTPEGACTLAVRTKPGTPCSCLTENGPIDGTAVRLLFDHAVLPRFEWPPPEFSSSVEVPVEILLEGTPVQRELKHVASKLKKALSRAGWESAFYGVPGGFAVASQPEQFNPDGSAKDGNERLASLPFFSRAYFRHLLMGSSGWFRIIVFVVTPYPFVVGDLAAEYPRARLWGRRGANKLAAGITGMQYTDDYSCTALVYEFEQSGPNSKPVLKVPGTLPAKMHLRKSGLWRSLRENE